MISKGHALAAAAGISFITRRLMHAPNGYGQKSSYDFVGYFEFDEEHVSAFKEVMAALRDVSQNPEWKYVREGPEWWGWPGRGKILYLRNTIRLPAKGFPSTG